jgi:hypothetical protein
MPSKNSLAGKTATVKIEYIERPCSVKIESIDEHGIWIEGGEIQAAIQQQFSTSASKGQHQPAVPLNVSPVFFFPFCKVLWIAVQKTK